MGAKSWRCLVCLLTNSHPMSRLAGCSPIANYETRIYRLMHFLVFALFGVCNVVTVYLFAGYLKVWIYVKLKSSDTEQTSIEAESRGQLHAKRTRLLSSTSNHFGSRASPQLRVSPNLHATDRESSTSSPNMESWSVVATSPQHLAVSGHRYNAQM